MPSTSKKAEAPPSEPIQPLDSSRSVPPEAESAIAQSAGKRLPTPRSGSRPTTSEQPKRLPTPRAGSRPSSRIDAAPAPAAADKDAEEEKDAPSGLPKMQVLGLNDLPAELPFRQERRLSSVDKPSGEQLEALTMTFDAKVNKFGDMDLPIAQPAELLTEAEKGSPLLKKLIPMWNLPLKEDEDVREDLDIEAEQAEKLGEVLKVRCLGQIVMLFADCGPEYDDLLHNAIVKSFGEDRATGASFELAVRIMVRMIRGDDGWRDEQLSIIRRSVRRHRYNIQRTLQEFDLDGDGFISEKEFRKALRKVGIRIQPVVIRELYHGLTYGAEQEGQKMSAIDFLNHAGINPNERALTVSRQEKSFLEKFLREEDWEDQRAGFSRDRFASLMTKYKIVLHGHIKSQLMDLIDADASGDISKRELLVGVLLLLGGKEEDRKELLYDLVDANGDGLITKKELTVVMGTINNEWVTDDGMEHFRDQRDGLFDQVDGNKDGAIDKAEFDKLVTQLPALNDIISIRSHDQDVRAGANGHVNFVELDRRVALQAMHLMNLTDFLKKRDGLVWMHQYMEEVRVRVEYGSAVTFDKVVDKEPVVRFEYWYDPSGGEDLVPHDVNHQCEVFNKYAVVEFMHRNAVDQSFAKMKETGFMLAKRFPGMEKYLMMDTAMEMYHLATPKAGTMNFDQFRAFLTMELKGTPAQKAMLLYALCMPKSRQSVVKEQGAVVYQSELLNIMTEIHRGVLSSKANDPAFPITPTQVDACIPKEEFAKNFGWTNLDSSISWGSFVTFLEAKPYFWELFTFNSVKTLEKGQTMSDLLAF